MNTPHLDLHIMGMVRMFPTLFKARDWDISRIRCLEHMFFVIGNGYEWKDGMLIRCGSDAPDTGEHLPENFFEETLWRLAADPLQIPSIENALQGTFHYVQTEPHRETVSVYFQATEEKAIEIFGEYHIPPDPKFNNERTPRAACAEPTHCFWSTVPYAPTFYRLCNYSALVELTNGVTVEGETIDPNPEWVAGARDVAQYALSSYLDKDRSEFERQNFYFSLGKRTEIGKKDEYWTDHVDSQISYLQAFFDKFK